MMLMRRMSILVRVWKRRRQKARALSRAGLGLSITLHVLVALLIVFGRGDAPPPAPEPVLIVDVVQEAAPVVEPTAGDDDKQHSESRRPEIAVKGQRAAAPTENATPTLGALFDMVERAHRPEPIHSQPAHEAADIVADIGGGEYDSPHGRLGNTTLKDFIRAQIERRWQVDAHHRTAGDIVVTLHLVLGAGGSVDKVEIVDEAAHKTDPLYRLVAIAGRDAALLSSPLQLPAGMAADSMDITLDLNTKDAMR